MSNEEDIVGIFKSTFKNMRNDRILLYGTGLNAARIVKEVQDFNIIGTMDAAREGQIWNGYKVYAADDLKDLKPDLLIIVARPSVVDIIYERIRLVVEEMHLPVYTADGREVTRSLSEKLNNPYFNVSSEMLMVEIQKHEVISFDIFDTLLMRKVFSPADVFEILQKQMGDRLSFDFAKARIDAETKLLKDGVPDLDQIYAFLKDAYQLPDALISELKIRELQIEDIVLCPREKMKRIFQWCLENGKKVYLVSDMYLTGKQLQIILKKHGITGYAELFVSCDYGRTKEKGLFQMVFQKEPGKKWLHIGDNKKADIVAAEKWGVDTFYIMSAHEMFENSLHRELLIYGKTLQERIMLGLYSCKLFNDPFCLYRTDGKPEISENKSAAYLFVAPCLASFIIWLYNRTTDSRILFGARDGYLLQKIYQKLCEVKRISPAENVYLWISRYSIMAEEKTHTAYGDYLKQMISQKKEQVFVDFMSKGTCQYYLQKVLQRRIKGAYFQKSEIGNDPRSQQEYESFCNVTDAFTSEYAIFQYCDFLETIVTDYVASFRGMENEKCLFFKDIRSKHQLEWLSDMQNGILEYAEEFYQIVPGMEDVDFGFGDHILKMIGRKYSRLGDEFRNLVLYDAGEDKIIELGELFAF